MDVEKRINEEIDKLKPYLQNDGGNIEFIKFEDGIVYVKLTGACAGCSMIDVTLKEGIEAAIMSEVKNVRGVINVA